MRSFSTTVALVATLVSGTARGGLARDADVIADHLRASASVTRLAPRLYLGGSGGGGVGSGGTAVFVPLPIQAIHSHENRCAKVVVVGAVSSVFGLRVPGGAGDDFFPSVAGLAEITRCGDERAALSELVLEMHSARAVVELLVASSPAPLPSVRAFVPHRDPGVVPPPRNVGPAPNAAPFDQRQAAIERRFKAAGASRIDRRVITTGHDGRGHTLLDLVPGCHSLAALAVPATPAFPESQDVDAELDWSSGAPAAVDREDTPDAFLLACTGRRQLAVLSVFVGTSAAEVLVIHGRRELPPGLPERWGAEPRARLARAFFQRHVPAVSSRPVLESFGVGEMSRLPIEVLPGQCYVAGVSPLQSEPSLVSFGITADAARSYTHTTDASVAALLTFCAGASGRAIVDLRLHGAGAPAWGFAMWPLGRRVLGEESP